jgi:transcriptional regulator with XRE-family HTH domain
MPESPVRPDGLDAIAKRLRLLREALGLTQQAMSDVTGVGRTSITNYETATRRPDVDEAIKISAATGVPIDWIYTGNLAGFLPAHIAASIRAIEDRQEEKRSRNSA